jgi:hypothetical protein
MDKLELFIRKNREDLDKYEPPKSSWRRIKAGMKTGRSIVPVWFSAAAVVIAILGSALILFSLNQNKVVSISQGNTGQLFLRETEVYYNSLVNKLYFEAKPLLADQPEIAYELRTDMAQLDSICTDIRRDLKDNVANQEVIEALIQNYRIKLQLLEDMLNLLKENENKPEKNKSHEL